MNTMLIVGLLVTAGTGIPVATQIYRQHDRALVILFLTEMWERFSFYGMRSLLVFYLIQNFLLTDAESAAIYGTYAAMVYLMPLAGGVITDRYLGAKEAIKLGAILLIAGQLCLAANVQHPGERLVIGHSSFAIVSEGRMGLYRLRIEDHGVARTLRVRADGDLEIGGSSSRSKPLIVHGNSFRIDAPERGPTYLIYIALSSIVVGVGLLKPNTTRMVSGIYQPDDVRRESGFTLFYYGINLGSFWATIACGYLAQRFGWSVGFGTAGVGMMIGLALFTLGGKSIATLGLSPDPERLRRPVFASIPFGVLLRIGIVTLIVPLSFLLAQDMIVGAVLAVTAAATIVWFIFNLLNDRSLTPRRDLAIIAAMMLGSIVFWALFDQAATSVSIFTLRNVRLAGFSAAQAQAFNGAFVLIFAPLMAPIWMIFTKRKINVNPLIKFGISLALIGLGFYVLSAGQYLHDTDFKVPLTLLIVMYFFHSVAELCLSPVGLAQITQLAAKSSVSVMIAIWFLSSSVGHYLGSKIGAALGTTTIAGQVTNAEDAFARLTAGFAWLGLAGTIAGISFIISGMAIRSWFKAPASR